MDEIVFITDLLQNAKSRIKWSYRFLDTPLEIICFSSYEFLFLEHLDRTKYFLCKYDSVTFRQACYRKLDGNWQ